jgi:hypothetical protein
MYFALVVRAQTTLLVETWTKGVALPHLVGTATVDVTALMR